MIEDAMFLALGFFAAMLMALACIPILWARALRLTRHRLELRVPLSAAEIEAERDGIRAEAAIAYRRLEQALEASKTAAASLSADMGHRTVSLVDAERTLAARDAERAGLTAELESLVRTNRDEQAQRVAAEKALHDADAHIASLGLDAQEQRANYEGLAALAEDHRRSIAAVEAEKAQWLAQVAGRDEDLAQLTSSLNAMRSTVAELTRERDTARNEALLATTRRQIVEAQLRIETERGRERDQREAAQTEAREAEAGKTLEQTETAAIDLAPFADLKRQFDALQARLAEPPRLDPRDAPAQDRENRALRSAIVAVGEAALRRLGPSDEAETSGDAAEDPALHAGDRR